MRSKPTSWNWRFEAVRWAPDGSKVATNLYEAAAGDYAIKVTCKCAKQLHFQSARAVVAFRAPAMG